MNRLKINYILLAMLTIVICSCEDEDLVTLNPSATISAVSSKTAVVLTKEDEGTEAINISWPQPEYGFSASPTYIINMDKEDGDFGAPVTINNGSSLARSFKVEDLNKHLINLGFEPGVSSKVKIRVDARLGTHKTISSEIISVDATAYTAYLDLSTTWGIVGSGYNDWGAFPDAPFFSTGTPNVIVAYVKLLDGEIKFRENNDWGNNLGDDGGDGTLEANGANIAVTAGHYKISFNTAQNTYTIVPFSWGIVGSAYNDWGNDGPDFPFTYDDATDQWRAIVQLKAGDFKIRKNNDWGLNYGDDGGDGTLESGGANISVAAGKYQVTFNESDLTIEIIEIPNIWGLVGSAYNDWGNGGPDAQFDRDWRNDGVWILKNVTLLAGQFKIRDANDWGTNYGDNDANGSLELNGSDITTVAGIFTITLDFSNPDSPTWTSIKH